MPIRALYEIKLPIVHPGDNPQVYCNVEPPEGLQCISNNSTRAKRRAVESMARYFRREFDYDNIQFHADVYSRTSTAFLWTAPAGRGNHLVIGACHFDWVEYLDVSGWSLMWVWLHPYKRNKGCLKAAWPYFKARFGNFYTERPLSPAMQSFLSKYDSV